MEEKTTIKLKETVTVRKFDHTEEDHPTEPFEVVVQESITEISQEEAASMGFIPLCDTIQASATLTVDGKTEEPK